MPSAVKMPPKMTKNQMRRAKKKDKKAQVSAHPLQKEKNFCTDALRSPRRQSQKVKPNPSLIHSRSHQLSRKIFYNQRLRH
jgi:hypothetical protein